VLFNRYIPKIGRSKLKNSLKVKGNILCPNLLFYRMNPKESMLIALRAITSQQIRIVSNYAWIFIGVTVVVLMTTAIKGIENSFQQGISSLGSDVLMFKNGLGFRE